MDICKLANGIRKFAVGFWSGASSELHGKIFCQYLHYCGTGSQKLHDHWSKRTIYKLKRHFNGYFRSLTVRNIRFCKVLGFYFYFHALPMHSVFFVEFVRFFTFILQEVLKTLNGLTVFI